jgi:hypothetical protein
VQVPDVRTLDYIKRGLDANIDAGFRGEGMTKAEAVALKQLRNQFRDRLDELVPEYKAARAAYAGDMEVIDAMRSGFEDFGKLTHEQVMKAVAGMSEAEKQAYRTGVARNLYGRIMNPSAKRNSAEELIGSPEMSNKLKPLFDSPAQFELFRAALARESELFQNANQILAGSQTGKRSQMRSKFETDESFNDAMISAATGGWTSGLTRMVTNLLASGKISDRVAEKLAPMLMSQDPQEVASVVRLLEQQALKDAPKPLNASTATAGAVTGTSIAAYPVGLPEEESP